MTGGGLKNGLVYGATDEVGMRSVENITEVHDLHATILQLLGLDHKKLIYRFGGRDVSLTDVHGHVIQDILV
jgi:arylsulfatase A-like enzyme